MSIAVTAPQMFDYQDWVCIATAMPWIHLPGTRCELEPAGGEDARLQLPHADAAAPRVWDMQVKGGAGAVTLATVSECLAHFPSRAHEGSLLERWLVNDHVYVLLVLAGRADDAVAPLTQRWPWDGQPHATLPRVAVALAVLQALQVRAGAPPSSVLEAKRSANLNKVLGAIDTSAMQRALTRLVLLDGLSDGSLKATTRDRLIQDHRIPLNRIDAVLVGLHAGIADAKQTRSDAIDTMRAYLAHQSPDTVGPLDYVPRGTENAWKAELEARFGLLLSGPPRSGKSAAARAIASLYETAGYEVRVLHDVSTADRFLREPGPNPRLAVLDDPLGSEQPSPSAAEEMAQLDRMATRLRGNRKLIVAQMEGPIHVVTGLAHLPPLPMSRLAWHDLDQAPASFLRAVWHALRTEYALPEALFGLVDDALASGAWGIEAGCLAHLAANSGRLEPPFGLASAMMLARELASTQGRVLEAQGLGSLLRALAIATTAREPVNERELAYILDTTWPRADSLQQRKGAISFAPENDDDASPPSYPTLPSLDAAARHHLGRLEELRLIEWRDGAVNFTHPFYRAVAESRLEPDTTAVRSEVVVQAERALTCLSSTTTRACARNLPMLYARVPSSLRSALVDAAASTMRSIYPATRDQAFAFLIDAPEPDARFDHSEWINNLLTVSLAEARWDQGEARYKRRGFGLHWNGASHRTLEAGEVQGAMQAIGDASGPPPTAEDAWRVTRHFERKPQAMSSTAMRRLQSYDEALIRAAAIEAWLSQDRTDDGDILERIFAERHPVVALAALDGVLTAWSRLPESRIQRLTQGLVSLTGSAANSAAMFLRLLVFERHECSGPNPPWALFAALFPNALSRVPATFRFDTARLHHVVGEAQRALDVDASLSIGEAWSAFLERCRPPPGDAYLLSAADRLLDGTRSAPARRGDLLPRLLALPGTAARGRLVADLIARWDELEVVERDAVGALLRAPSPDHDWMRAIVLTRGRVPPVLLDIVLPQGPLLTASASVLIERLPADLIMKCVRLYVGEPGIAASVELNSGCARTWRRVLNRLAHDASHPAFELAWLEIARGPYSGRLTRLTRRLARLDPERAFTMLLMLTSVWRKFLPDAWTALFDTEDSPTTQADWLGRMAERSPTILDRVVQFRDWVPRQHQAAFAAHIEADLLVIALINRVDEINREDFWPSVSTVLEHMLRDRPPVFLETWDLARNLMMSNNSTASDFAEFLEQGRQRALARIHYRAYPEPFPLDDWTYGA